MPSDSRRSIPTLMDDPTTAHTVVTGAIETGHGPPAPASLKKAGLLLPSPGLGSNNPAFCAAHGAAESRATTHLTGGHKDDVEGETAPRNCSWRGTSITRCVRPPAHENPNAKRERGEERLTSLSTDERTAAARVEAATTVPPGS
ncbi:hypothetical protein F8O01_15945 [Pseudoclavibacter chungangensis]|uniref:Uncharacterized protein n=1 Tax=Pseudoclavibacter chungangensis TaxID=587635 RepID=A0A7J5BMT0_9MICO|nr:hypothetical protein [Pseudoclavibacter chungangensis]KAB1652974.1 hypothetical protein F8O01_15945 [Pseudoclavibacter chungangensis]NYJ65226.1 hypothetical protein [Pseudoclavibacter chungangensis]